MCLYVCALVWYVKCIYICDYVSVCVCVSMVCEMYLYMCMCVCVSVICEMYIYIYVHFGSSKQNKLLPIYHRTAENGIKTPLSSPNGISSVINHSSVPKSFFTPPYFQQEIKTQA